MLWKRVLPQSRCLARSLSSRRSGDTTSFAFMLDTILCMILQRNTCPLHCVWYGSISLEMHNFQQTILHRFVLYMTQWQWHFLHVRHNCQVHIQIITFEECLQKKWKIQLHHMLWSKVNKKVRLFLGGAITVPHTALWHHYLNKNV